MTEQLSGSAWAKSWRPANFASQRLATHGRGHVVMPMKLLSIVWGCQCVNRRSRRKGICLAIEPDLPITEKRHEAWRLQPRKVATAAPRRDSWNSAGPLQHSDYLAFGGSEAKPRLSPRAPPHRRSRLFAGSRRS